MPEKPKIWTISDIPTPAEMETYLSRIRAAGAAFPGISGFPVIPSDMDNLTVEGANDIERLLASVHGTIEALEKSRVYSGELQTGGV